MHGEGFRFESLGFEAAGLRVTAVPAGVFPAQDIHRNMLPTIGIKLPEEATGFRVGIIHRGTVGTIHRTTWVRFIVDNFVFPQAYQQRFRQRMDEPAGRALSRRYGRQKSGVGDGFGRFTRPRSERFCMLDQHR